MLCPLLLLRQSLRYRSGCCLFLLLLTTHSVMHDAGGV